MRGMTDDDDVFRREWYGRPVVQAPSPGPWTFRKSKSRIGPSARDWQEVWVVLDANGKCVAECDSQVDAIHIAENAPTVCRVCGVATRRKWGTWDVFSCSEGHDRQLADSLDDDGNLPT